MWTSFADLYSGGYDKGPYDYIYIELPADEAVDYFERRFGRDPRHVTCPCCGPDYTIETDQTPEEATDPKRRIYTSEPPPDQAGVITMNPGRLTWTMLPLDQYLSRADVLVIRKEDL